MGKATRWLKGLLGLKKDKDNSAAAVGERKEKKRWGFSRKYSGDMRPASTADPAWLRSYLADSEQSKHAVAVAAATAAAADAAVAAAQAAVAVVRLFAGGREKLAAVRIQTVFRGFLARKALRALKGLVKIQALVRGYLVRKRAAATLYSMQALIRTQAAILSQRANRARMSTERLDEDRAEFHRKRISPAPYDSSLSTFDNSPKTVEIDTYGPRSRSNGDDYSVSSPLPCPGPAHMVIPVHHYWGFIAGEDYKFATAQNTPRWFCCADKTGPNTPAKSVCGGGVENLFRPGYMANTLSSRAKLRSRSAPKQRPADGGARKRLSLNDVMASRSSFSSGGSRF